MDIKTRKNADIILDVINKELFSKRDFEKPDIQDLEFVSIKENSRFIPIKITKEEAVKTHKCQKAMLDFMFVQYQSSVGTGQEEHMRKLYHDACVDYDEFLNAHRELLS